MIANPFHQDLCEAADQAGWDEESMMLHATRFLCRLASDNPQLEEQFQGYLHEQILAEAPEKAPIDQNLAKAVALAARDPLSEILGGTVQQFLERVGNCYLDIHESGYTLVDALVDVIEGRD